MPHRMDFTSYEILSLSFINANVNMKVDIVVAINDLLKLAESYIQYFQSN